MKERKSGKYRKEDSLFPLELDVNWIAPTDGTIETIVDDGSQADGRKPLQGEKGQGKTINVNGATGKEARQSRMNTVSSCCLTSSVTSSAHPSLQISASSRKSGPPDPRTVIQRCTNPTLITLNAY